MQKGAVRMEAIEENGFVGSTKCFLWFLSWRAVVDLIVFTCHTLMSYQSPSIRQRQLTYGNLLSLFQIIPSSTKEGKDLDGFHVLILSREPARGDSMAIA